MTYNGKSQSALEYMMTYGWAILIIVIVAAILYSMGIFTPASSVTTTSSGFSPFAVTATICNQAGMKIAITAGGLPNNAASVTITGISFQSNTGTTASMGQEYNVTPVTIASGQSTTITVPTVACPSAGAGFSLSSKLQYSYSTVLGNIAANATGTIAGKSSQAPDTTFTAYNLPAGASWTVNYGGVNETSTSNFISFTSQFNKSFRIYPSTVNGLTYYSTYIAAGKSIQAGYNLELDFIPNSRPLYVGEQGYNNISVFYPDNFSMGANITVPGCKVQMVQAVNGSFVYIPRCGLGVSVSIVSASTNSFVKNTSVGSSPEGVAITPNGEYAYVSNFGSNTTSIINLSTGTAVKNVSVGLGPVGIAITPNGEYAYVVNQLGNTTTVISVATEKVIATIPVPGYPLGIAMSTNGEYVYVSEQITNSIAVIYTGSNEVVSTIHTPNSISPRGLAVNPNGKYLYVSDGSGGNVSVVSIPSNQLANGSIRIPYAKQFAFSPDGKLLFTTTPYANPYQLHLIYISNNSYVNLTTAQHYPNICAITVGPIGNGAGC